MFRQIRNFTSISRRLNTNVTFFTKDTCMLCTNAKNILHETLQETDGPIHLNTIDIMDPKNSEWYDKYCYDVPVVHIEKNDKDMVKFMHYFYKDKIKAEL